MVEADIEFYNFVFHHQDKIGPAFADKSEPMRLLNYQYGVWELASQTDTTFEQVEAHIKRSVASGAYRLADYVLATERKLLHTYAFTQRMREMILKDSSRAA